MGATLMLTNHPELDRAKILELYRHKGYLEKTLDVVNGRLFIKFISLVKAPR